MEKQYPEIQREDEESWKAFLRRINKVRVYHEKGKCVEYDSVELYLGRKRDFMAVNDKDNPFLEGG